MANDINIKVRADQKDANLEQSRRESAGLRDQVLRDATQMEKASKRLEDAKRRQADAAGALRVAETKLSEVQEKSGASMSKLAAAEEGRAKQLRVNEAAAKAVADAEERLKKIRDQPAEQPGQVDTSPEKIKIDWAQGFSGLREGLLGEAKSAGMQAGAIIAGALGAGLSTVAAAGIFVGIAAAAQSSNQQVSAAYSQMWDHVKAGAQDASSVLASDFIAGAESLGRTFNAIKPQLTEGFLAAKPVIKDVFDGIDRGARVAMPGLVTAAKAAGDASNGLADALQSTGQGVANFFTEASKGAGAGGDAFRAFGQIVERLGSFAGRIIAELANNSITLFPQVAQTVDAAAGAIENLAHTALPGIATGAGLALSGLTLLLNLASSLASALGPLIPLAGTFATSMKLIDMVSFGQVGASWDRLKTSIGDAEGFAGKAKAGMSSLVSGGLLPLMLAGVGVTGILNELSANQQRAAKAAHDHQQNVSSLADALRQSKGAIDANVRATAAQSLANLDLGQTGRKVLQTASELGVSLPKLTDGFLGNKDAMGSVNAQLDALIASGTSYVETETSKQAVETESASRARILKMVLGEQNGTMNDAILLNKALSGASGESSAATSVLAADFKALADKAGNANTKVDALMKILDTMAGRKPDVEEATKAWEDFIDTFTKKDIGFTSKNADAKKFVQTLVDTSGQINITTEDGRKLFEAVRKGEKDFMDTAVAMKGSGESAEEVRAKLGTMREAFVKSAEEMGFTQKQAETLADKYGLIPDEVTTIMYSNLSPEIQKALELGGHIRALPDGSFIVTANTANAQYQVTKFIQDNQGKVITVHVNTVTGAQLNVSNGSFSRLKAAGGPVSHAAEGGARTGPVMVNERQNYEGIRTPQGDLIDMQVGSTVVPTATMAGMRQQGGGQTIHLEFHSDGTDYGDFMVAQMRRAIRVRGGDVQTALGAK